MTRGGVRRYNLVLRFKVAKAPRRINEDFKTLCKGNLYTTTIHAINSLIVKASKLTKAARVYRGVGNGLLPQAFWEPNAEGARGGVEVR